MGENFIQLERLDVYVLSLEYSRKGWEIYDPLDWRIKKIIGDQFIESVDSSGANIAEGYGRFHYLDRIKFYYNARGSLYESRHWLLLMKERSIISEAKNNEMNQLANRILQCINAMISSQYQAKKTNSQ